MCCWSPFFLFHLPLPRNASIPTSHVCSSHCPLHHLAQTASLLQDTWTTSYCAIDPTSFSLSWYHTYSASWQGVGSGGWRGSIGLYHLDHQDVPSVLFKNVCVVLSWAESIEKKSTLNHPIFYLILHTIFSFTFRFTAYLIQRQEGICCFFPSR